MNKRGKNGEEIGEKLYKSSFKEDLNLGSSYDEEHNLPRLFGKNITF
jgi:hypothetical protein